MPLTTLAHMRSWFQEKPEMWQRLLKSTEDALNPKKELSRINRPHYAKLHHPYASEAFKAAHDDKKTRQKAINLGSATLASPMLRHIRKKEAQKGNQEKSQG